MEQANELRARYHFRVRQLLVAPELLGTSHELEEAGRRVVITLPVSEAESSKDAPLPPFPEEEPAPIEIGGFATASSSLAMSETFARVAALRVDVFVPAEGITAALFREQVVD